MIEIFSTAVMGGILGYSWLQKNGATNENAKIQKIAKNCGLLVKEKNGEKTELRTMQLYRRKHHDWGTEFIYRIPLGLSFNDFKNKLPNFQDGLNNKHSILEISKQDIKELIKTKDLQTLLNKKKTEQKRVEMSYDGMLHIKVFRQSDVQETEFDLELFQQCKGWEVPVGESDYGLVKHNFDRLPHVIVAGSTGYGKSQYLKLLITFLVHQKKDNVRLFLIDLKGGLAFSRFKKLEQVKGFARNVSEANVLLKSIQDDMSRKIDQLESKGYEDVSEAKEKVRTFVIIDEAADLDKDSRELVEDISRRGRGPGYRLVYSTQYPTNQTLNSQIRANIGAVISYRLKTVAQSLATLDEEGAEKIPLIPGRAIYKDVEKRIVQTPLLQNERITEILSPYERREQIERRESGSDSVVIKKTRLS